MRITGSFRGQSANPEAPKGFELSHPWKVWKTGRTPLRRFRTNSPSSRNELFEWVGVLSLFETNILVTV